jgi:hypothetical protein
MTFPIRGFTITLRHNTLSRTALDEGSAHRIDLFLTAHNTNNIHAPSAIRTHNPRKRAAADPHPLDGAANGTGKGPGLVKLNVSFVLLHKMRYQG